MSTMKKLFALTLALAMLMSVSAFAADFSDKSSIDKECVNDVNLLTAIGIIEGNDDGTFGPKNTIKRSEAAAIIYRLRNGGVDDKAEGWKGASSFTDVADDIWYSGYVAYCEYYGIIDGKSATIFDPNAPVTTAELAKMLLTVAGYKSDVEGYTGSNWSKNVLTDATEAGIFENFGGTYSGACSREWACKLMANTILNVGVAVYLGDYLLPDTAIETVGEKYLSLDYDIAYVVANDEWSIHMDVAKAEKDQIKVSATGINTTSDITTVEYDLPTDMVGQQVMIATNDESGKVYGIVATGKTNVGDLEITRDGSSATAGATNEWKFTMKLNGKVYLNAVKNSDVNSGTKFYNTQGTSADYATYVTNYDGNAGVFKAWLAPNVWYEHNGFRGDDMDIKAWDSDGDGDLDRVIINTAVYGTVATEIKSSTKEITVALTAGNAGSKADSATYKLEDITVNGTLAQNAVVKVENENGKITLTVLDAVIGKLTQVSGNGSAGTLNMVIGGTTYKIAQLQPALGSYSIAYGEDMEPAANALLGKVVKVYTSTNGRVITAPVEYTTSTGGGTTTTTPSTIDKTKLAYLIDAQDVKISTTTTDEWGNVTDTPVIVKKVKVMFADGTSAIMIYDEDSKLTGAAKANALVTGKVYEFAVNADGEIVLFTNLSKATKVYYGAATTAGTAAAATLSNEVAYNLAKNRFGDVLVNDETLIFVKYVDKKGNDVYTVMKISEFKKGIDTKTFNLVARNSSAISTALVATVEFDGALPVDPAAPATPNGTYLIYATSATVKYNLGEDKDGNPINVAKFTAVDMTTGVAGEYYVADTDATVAVGKIYAGTFNDDGYLDEVPAATEPAEFAGTLTASSWLKGKVVAKSGEIILVDSTLIDKENLAKEYSVMEKDGDTFSAATYEDIVEAADKQDNNIVIKTDAEGKIVMIIYTADGKAF